MTMKYSHRHEATGAQRRGQPQAPREAGQAFGHTRRAGAEDTGEYDSRTSARGVGEAGREVASALRPLVVRLRGHYTAKCWVIGLLILGGLATANLRARPGSVALQGHPAREFGTLEGRAIDD